MDLLKSYKYGPVSEKKPKQLVLLLHGLGSDGRDLISLAQPFSEILPDAVFVSPNAPFSCDFSPLGYQWFSLAEWTPESILNGIQEAAPILDNFIDDELDAYGLEDKDLVLCGFSQGCMMSLYTGPRRNHKIAGIIGYSGALSWEDDVNYDELQKPPILLIHGNADPVVPVTAYYHAQHKLIDAGFDVTGGVTFGLMHGIDPGGINSGKAFLGSVFNV